MDIWQQIIEGASNSSFLEFVALIFGLWSVWLARQERIALYPTGLVNVAISIYICAIFGLYADMGINMYYLIISIYGWIHWQKGEKGNSLPITSLVKMEWVKGVLLLLVSFIIIGIILVKFTNSTVPMYDALTTSLFIVGMWWMAEKKIQHWLAWIVGDALSIPLYFYKGLGFFALQYLIFTIMAISGYIHWRKLMKK
ncbi:MAG: nicotinamide riboside transporter PnuC [Cyclobacteriaceae bacterium]|nr:nicotinamide riboside transporter PnuC [Cyclobacteriaceae bacterium]